MNTGKYMEGKRMSEMMLNSGMMKKKLGKGVKRFISNKERKKQIAVCEVLVKGVIDMDEGV